jgi:hypothetical protein
MTNKQRTDASRRNAKKSTGPRTVGGRRRSSMNALKHGMTAEDVVIPGENPAELRALHRSLIDAWKPVGAVEERFVWEITFADWRLRRAWRVEAVFANADTERGEREIVFELRVPPPLSRAVAEEPPSDKPEDAEPEKHKIDEPQPDSTPSALSAAEMLFGPHAINQLLRYETAAERSFYRALHTLERIQARRMGKDVSPPQVMHVHADE